MSYPKARIIPRINSQFQPCIGCSKLAVIEVQVATWSFQRYCKDCANKVRLKLEEILLLESA